MKMAEQECTDFQARFHQRIDIIDGALDVFRDIVYIVSGCLFPFRGGSEVISGEPSDIVSAESSEMVSASTTSELTSIVTPYDFDGILSEYELIKSDYQFQEITLLHSKGLRFVQLLSKLPHEQPNSTDFFIDVVSAYSEDIKSSVFYWNNTFQFAVDTINRYEELPDDEQNSNDLKWIAALKKAGNNIGAPINDFINAHNVNYANVPDNQVDNIHIFNQEGNHA
jgi:hypothetical protein